MDSNAIEICVRVRPWNAEKELPKVDHHVNQPFFLGDGTFVNSPRKPIAGGSLREVVEVMDSRQLDFDKPEPGSETRRGMPGAKRYKDKRYIFDHVFRMDASQEAVFERTAKPLLSGVLDGFNATVFAYGATGCGKTHTISGTAEDPGITIRIMRELFDMIEASKDQYDTTIELSMVEIYNELIRDLLNDDFPYCPRGGLKLQENERERVTLDRVTLKTPQSVEEVMDMVLLGNQRRSTSFTESNSVSSRSHAVLQINVRRSSKATEVDHDQAVVQRPTSMATLSIIDLAGSERASATRNMGARMKEGANINKSLLALSSCISALCAAPTRGSKPHVPYRNSKLTRMLKFSLGGNCRTVMIVCVSPSSKDIEDTHNTLVWANKAKNVSTKISRNTAGQHISVKQYLVTIDQQAQRIKLLEAKLAEENEGKGSENTYAHHKLLAARTEAQTVIQHARDELLAALPVISEGATQRALWDGAEMRISALTRVSEELDNNPWAMSSDDLAKEKAFIASLIQQQNSAFRFNKSVQEAVQREATANGAVDRTFKTAEERTFGDVLEKHDLEWFKLGVRSQRFELERQIASAREKGYRDSAQTQSAAFANAASLIFRFTSTVQEEADVLAGISQQPNAEDLNLLAERLRNLGTDIFSKMSALFSQTSLSHPPPLAQLPQAEPVSIAQILSPPRRPIPPSAQASQPVRLQVGPSARKSATILAHPAARRVLTSAVPSAPSSPARAARLANRTPLKSALRRAPFRVGHVKSRTPKKTARWKDEAGAGHLDDRSTALDATVFNSSSDNTDEWAEEHSGSLGSPPSAPKAAFAVPSSSSLSPQPLFTASKPRSSISSIAPPMPEWKKNRILLGKSGSGLSTLGEESEFGSPDKPPGPLGFGKPTRLARGPLTERQRNTPSPPSAPLAGTSAGLSSLLRPTLASLSKVSETSAGKMGPPSRRVSSLGSQKAIRRVSSIGPYASSTARKTRTSLAPGAGDVSTPSGLPVPVGSDTLSPAATGLGLAAGSKRMLVQPPTLSPTAETGPARRGSLMPRASMASLPRVNTMSSLGPRPSIPNLRQSMAGVGDSSTTRGPWR